MFVSIRQSELPFMKAAKIKNFIGKTNIRQIKLKKIGEIITETVGCLYFPVLGLFLSILLHICYTVCVIFPIFAFEIRIRKPAKIKEPVKMRMLADGSTLI